MDEDFSFLSIRQAVAADVPGLIDIFACARRFMAANGNPTQWGGGYPDAAQVNADVAARHCYVVEHGVMGIVGTFCLMAGSAVFAFPLGIMSGIYMHEYASNGRLIKFIRMMTNNLSGIPSIVFGLFGMSLFVNYLGFGDSIIAGSLTLGLLALPLVIRTTEEALKAIPDSYREGSLALGATKLQTIRKVILPMAMPNIITGLILALGRVSGETAPILFTCAAYYLPQLPDSIFDQCMALPYHLYVLATSGTDMERQIPIAYGTALVLIVIVFIINIMANAMRNYFQNKLKTN